MNKKIIFAAIAIVLAALASCDDFNTMEEPEMKTTSTFPINGEYWVTYTQKSSGDPVIGGRHIIMFTNTAADQGDSLLVTDNHGGTGAYFKTAVNMENLTFGSDDAYDMANGREMTVSNGQFFENGTTSKTNVETDSIYLEMSFASKPDSVIVVAGYKRTGWPDDDF